MLSKNSYFQPLNHVDALSCLAILAASKAGCRGEVPVGAVLCASSGTLLSEVGNQVLMTNNPMGHAELRAMTQGAARQFNYRLSGCQLVSSLQPCPMCLGAMEAARLSQWIFLAEKSTENSQENLPQEKVHGIPCEEDDLTRESLQEECQSTTFFSQWSVALLRFFFEQRR
ncbi:MAG TPA: hypothetical protein DCS88_12500 [Alphaproteobacteria bacterium]|nr:hypothetical protein [Alphaproteobacteria bacterium]